jgi:hypothetical protein
MVTTGGTGPADANLRLDDGPSFDTVWVDCVQVEKRPFASSYADYLQGLGYSGSAGIPSVREAGAISYLVPNDFLPTVGTMGLWLCPNWDADDDETHVLSDLADEEFRNRMVFKKDSAGKLVFAVWDDNSTLKQKATDSPVSWLAGDWVHIAATWNSGTFTLYINGATPSATTSGSGTGVVTSVASKMFIGSSFDKKDQADGLITDVFLKETVIGIDEADALAKGGAQYLGAFLNLGGVPGGRGKAVTDATVGNETTVPHGLGVSPSFIHITPMGSGVVYLSQDWDDTNFYVKGTASSIDFSWRAEL